MAPSGDTAPHGPRRRRASVAGLGNTNDRRHCSRESKANLSQTENVLDPLMAWNELARVKPLRHGSGGGNIEPWQPCSCAFGDGEESQPAAREDAVLRRLVNDSERRSESGGSSSVTSSE